MTTKILSEWNQILSTVNQVRSEYYPTLPFDLIKKIIDIEKEYLDVQDDALTHVHNAITEYLKYSTNQQEIL